MALDFVKLQSVLGPVLCQAPRVSTLGSSGVALVQITKDGIPLRPLQTPVRALSRYYVAASALISGALGCGPIWLVGVGCVVVPSAQDVRFGSGALGGSYLGGAFIEVISLAPHGRIRPVVRKRAVYGRTERLAATRIRER